MSLITQHSELQRFVDRVGHAATRAAGIISEALTSRPRAAFAPPANSTSRVQRLIEAGARTEAALALIETELPQWQLRRLTFDGGEWHCALSRHGEMPNWLDQPIETHHADLARAIYAAFVSARKLRTSSSPDSPRGLDGLDETACPDNFS
jgi:hypothetical protein